ncbi:HD domain-containing phosphohydrolase [Undibacterium sp. RTI2.1]|uniref:HD-GYP domain-containing protein n=1 Tax=unclassified Undibacterium TaxID=2630295 RepID=UPI002AB51FEE|nr:MULTISPECIES: HD domain-containing phosphohydrolase [unclassified Undibacterium]MDY7538798.1 HD domain-containing phosphohydrolase [Undibacterium sp. 5I1]MEB0032009.1 HD domain-containing phosphohydrolase [Undibacterium sp. RTI2.1]MEB0118219.1 HD domain-containing phosphohydrolase [Undibacterium sp. RTI2.2]MEB0232917.1 HD domain-containing phosphohydrolase [Undibacterium sp. 10I3]MEB0258398.1 HD domain-containing phosphohydrolase [Undibacterium sp. 5I1]
MQWDVYGGDGSLLLRKGFVVSNVNQVSALIERGLFADVEKSDKAIRDKRQAEKQIELPSVVRMINTSRTELRRISYNIASEPNAQEQFLALGKQVATAVSMNQEVALGCILLNQDDTYATRHCVDTAVVAILVARALKKPPEEIIRLTAAALTMNLSMLRQQEKLQGKNESLTPEEQDFIQQHPEATVRQLRSAGINDEDWLYWILYHHENEDGSGYPGKKSANDIPLNAKIISIADRYGARVFSRSYRKSLLPNAALRDILIEGKGKIDIALVTAFIRELGTYPIGTFVRLENGEIGVVTGRGSSTTTPYVHALIGPRGAPLSVPGRRDTQHSLQSIREVLHRDQVPIRFTMRHLWGDIASM